MQKDKKKSTKLDQIKIDIQNSISAIEDDLTNLSKTIHDHPEVGWEEKKASAWLTDYLKKKKFKVTRGIADLPTAFKAVYGKGRPVLAFLAEYDALPGLGHACGHNIIGTAAVGAGIAAKVLADLCGATIMVIGCPAEELLGGKVLMVEKGVFEGVDAALQMHPFAGGMNLAGFTASASTVLEVEYHGKEAHAGADPWNGSSALQALIQLFANVNGIRGQMRDNCRISGIITHGGEAVNIIPRFAAGKFQLRAPKNEELDELQALVLNCMEGAAMSTGCQLKYKWGMRSEAMKNNTPLMGLWKKNLASFDRQVGDIVTNSGSTDTGNVSNVVPTLHGIVSMSDKPVVAHSKEFAIEAKSKNGNKALIDGAKAMAMTAADLVLKRGALTKVKKAYLQSLEL